MSCEKPRLKLSFDFRNKLCFSWCTKKKQTKELVPAIVLLILDYGDLLCVPATALALIDTAYHASLRFITYCKALTHHCEPYTQVGWSGLVPACTTLFFFWWWFDLILSTMQNWNLFLSKFYIHIFGEKASSWGQHITAVMQSIMPVSQLRLCAFPHLAAFRPPFFFFLLLLSLCLLWIGESHSILEGLLLKLPC